MESRRFFTIVVLPVIGSDVYKNVYSCVDCRVPEPNLKKKDVDV